MFRYSQKTREAKEFKFVFKCSVVVPTWGFCLSPSTLSLLIHHFLFFFEYISILEPALNTSQLSLAAILGLILFSPKGRDLVKLHSFISHPSLSVPRLSLQISMSARSTTEAASRDALTPGDPTIANATRAPVYMWTAEPASVRNITASFGSAHVVQAQITLLTFLNMI